MPDDDQEQQRQAAEEAAAKAAQDAADAKAAAAAAEEEGEEFDKDRALATIKKQRESEDAAKKRAQELEAKVREYEDRDKTEAQKNAEAKDVASKEAIEAKSEVSRLRMAMKYGLAEEDLDLLGTGDDEQIEARAKRLAEMTVSSKEDPKGRPKERLKAGAVPGATANEDVEPGLQRLNRAYAQQ